MADRPHRPNAIVSQLASGVNFELNDVFIAIMGATGSGKSTFISRCVGSGVKIGYSLESCTSEVESFSFKYKDLNVCLIDTPGFDDTYRTDADVLKDIAFWLNASYKIRVNLSGIIYLHQIDLNRMTGSAYKNLRMFKKLCGERSLPSVVLATTMWSNVEDADGVSRENELKIRPGFWGDMMVHGSRVLRHEDTRASALNIVGHILDQGSRTVLEIQRQMVDEGKTLDETSAGQELNRELLKQRDLFERRLEEARLDMQEAISEGNRRAVEEAAEEQERFQKKLQEVMQGSNDLKVSMEKLLEQKDLEYRRTLQNLELERQASLDESKKAASQLEIVLGKMKVQEDQSRQVGHGDNNLIIQTTETPGFQHGLGQATGKASNRGADAAAFGLASAGSLILAAALCSVM